MPASVAALLVVIFIAFAVFGEARRKEAGPALWLPVLWMVICASRFPSQWMQLGSPLVMDEAAATEGSPLDAAYFASLILMGTIVLARRKIEPSRLIQMNLLLALFFAYGAVSILWSDFPFIAFKRWVKTLGHPIMALLILTDPNPGLAFRTVMKRCAYILLPLSVLFIKYLPEYGRGFDRWTGAPTNLGVGLTKNDLGYGCMVFGIFSVWMLLAPREGDSPALRRREVAFAVVLLSMAVWLLYMADSATSLGGLLIGSATLLALRFGLLGKKHIGTLIVTGLVSVLLIEWAFDAYARILELLGREVTLTDRTEIWTDVLALQDRPLIGAGFESFWLGPRLEAMWAKWWWHPNQAHSGYIETYLNLGLIGVGLLAALLLSTFNKIRSRLSPTFGYADLRFAFFFVIIAFNYTEAAFKAVHLVWTIFHLIAIDYRDEARQSATAPERARARRRYARGGSRWRRYPAR